MFHASSAAWTLAAAVSAVKGGTGGRVMTSPTPGAGGVVLDAAAHLLAAVGTGETPDEVQGEVDPAETPAR